MAVVSEGIFGERIDKQSAEVQLQSASLGRIRRCEHMC